LLKDPNIATLSIHPIPFFIFCIFLGGWLSALHHSFPSFLLLLAFFLAKIDTVKRTSPAKTEPRSYTLEIKDVGRVAWESYNKGIRIVEERVVAYRATLRWLEGCAWNTIEAW
jgi:hypothetical protein